MQSYALNARPLDWYDYGARFYDPQLARFHTIDPLAESFPRQTPFVYADNNPVRFIDFMGMNAQDPKKEKEENTYTVTVYNSEKEYQKAQDEKNRNENEGFSNHFYTSSSVFSLVNSVYGLNNDLNFSKTLSRVKGWKTVTGNVSKSLTKELGFSEMAKKITRSASKKALFMGAVYSTYDVTNNPSLENIAWNTLDVSVSALGLFSGYATIPSLLYFSGRIGSEIYESTKPQEPLIFQSEGWKKLNNKP